MTKGANDLDRLRIRLPNKGIGIDCFPSCKNVHFEFPLANGTKWNVSFKGFKKIQTLLKLGNANHPIKSVGIPLKIVIFSG